MFLIHVHPDNSVSAVLRRNFRTSGSNPRQDLVAVRTGADVLKVNVYANL